MTLYIKGTDVRIVGTLEQLTGTAQVVGLNSDGSICWSGARTIHDESETVLRGDKPVWISEDGGEYATNAVEDRLDDGTTVSFAPLKADPVRPVTGQIRGLWRHAVQHRQTELGLSEWGEDLPVKTWLLHHGLVLAERDPFVNEKFEGAWQITEPYQKLETPMEDAQEMGIFAIVGDDVEALIADALVWVESS